MLRDSFVIKGNGLFGVCKVSVGEIGATSLTIRIYPYEKGNYEKIIYLNTEAKFPKTKTLSISTILNNMVEMSFEGSVKDILVELFKRYYIRYKIIGKLQDINFMIGINKEQNIKVADFLNVLGTYAGFVWNLNRDGKVIIADMRLNLSNPFSVCLENNIKYNKENDIIGVRVFYGYDGVYDYPTIPTPENYKRYYITDLSVGQPIATESLEVAKRVSKNILNIKRNKIIRTYRGVNGLSRFGWYSVLGKETGIGYKGVIR